MRERLWEIASEPLSLGIVALREQSDIVPYREQALEEPKSVIAAAEKLPVVHQPEAAE